MPYNKIEVRSLSDLDRVQSEIQRAFREIEMLLIGARQPVEVTLGAAATAVAHRLGAPVRKIFVVGKNAEADIWETAPEHADPRNYINLQASATVTAKLVFL